MVEDLLTDQTHLKSIMKNGAEKAAAVADLTLARTYEALGLVSRD